METQLLGVLLVTDAQRDRGPERGAGPSLQCEASPGTRTNHILVPWPPATWRVLSLQHFYLEIPTRNLVGVPYRALREAIQSCV